MTQVTLPLLAAGRNVLSFEAMPRNAHMVRGSVGLNRDNEAMGRHVLVNKAVVNATRHAEGSPASVCVG